MPKHGTVSRKQHGLAHSVSDARDSQGYLCPRRDAGSGSEKRSDSRAVLLQEIKLVRHRGRDHKAEAPEEELASSQNKEECSVEIQDVQPRKGHVVGQVVCFSSALLAKNVIQQSEEEWWGSSSLVELPDRNIITGGGERFRCSGMLSPSFIGEEVNDIHNTKPLASIKSDGDIRRKVQGFEDSGRLCDLQEPRLFGWYPEQEPQGAIKQFVETHVHSIGHACRFELSGALQSNCLVCLNHIPCNL